MLRRKYGIGLSEYQDLFRSQHGLCAICESDGRLHVDHSHTTGEVRGLLCSNCNVALGMFQDSAEALRKAADYVDQNGDVW